MQRRKLVRALSGFALALAVNVGMLLWLMSHQASIVEQSGPVLAVQQPTEPPGVTRENYYRLRIGMNRTAVEAILGPAGDHTTGEVVTWSRRTSGPPMTEQEWKELPSWPFWASDEAGIAICFDVNGAATRFVYSPYGKKK